MYVEPIFELYPLMSRIHFKKKGIGMNYCLTTANRGHVSMSGSINGLRVVMRLICQLEHRLLVKKLNWLPN
jgi:hypothetical protein